MGHGRRGRRGSHVSGTSAHASRVNGLGYSPKRIRSQKDSSQKDSKPKGFIIQLGLLAIELPHYLLHERQMSGEIFINRPSSNHCRHYLRFKLKEV